MDLERWRPARARPKVGNAFKCGIGSSLNGKANIDSAAIPSLLGDFL